MSVIIPMQIPDHAYSFVFETDFEDTLCDLSEVFTNVKVLPSTTASASTQLLVKIKPERAPLFFLTYLDQRRREGKDTSLFIKVLPNLINMEDNRVVIEMHLYRYLKERLVDTHVTPNIMTYVATAKCHRLFDQLEPSMPHLRENIVQWAESYTGLDDIVEAVTQMQNTGYLLMVEAGHGHSLFRMLSEQRLPKKELIPVFFQIAYTIHQMYRVHVRHNDLHMGNIWINVEPRPRTLVYMIDKQHVYQFTTIYVVKIYDYDLATWTSSDMQPDPPQNFAIERLCPLYGTCSTPDPRYDLFTVVSSLAALHMDEVYPAIEDIVESTILNPDLLDASRCCIYPQRYCMRTIPSNPKRPCNRFGKIPSRDMRHFPSLIRETDLFERYEIPFAKIDRSRQEVYVSVGYQARS